MGCWGLHLFHFMRRLCAQREQLFVLSLLSLILAYMSYTSTAARAGHGFLGNRGGEQKYLQYEMFCAPCSLSHRSEGRINFRTNSELNRMRTPPVNTVTIFSFTNWMTLLGLAIHVYHLLDCLSRASTDVCIQVVSGLGIPRFALDAHDRAHLRTFFAPSSVPF